MEKIEKFYNNLFSLEVKIENDKSLFDVETVARSLGFTEEKNGKEYVRWRTVNGYLKKYLSQEVAKNDFISEQMVYKLAFKANNALAEKFQDWLAAEVLPSIRKHGMFATDELLNNPDLLISMATKLKEEKQKRITAEERVQQLKPKAHKYDAYIESEGLVTASIIAKNYGMCARKFNELLHELGVQYKQKNTWLLYAKYQDKGYTHVSQFSYEDSEGLSKVRTTTKWTAKGHMFLYDLLREHGYYPNIELVDDSYKELDRKNATVSSV